MAHQNPKSQFIEWCNRNKFPVVSFNTERLPGNPDHVPFFKSTYDFQGRIYEGFGSSKKEAEQVVCQSILKTVFSTAEKKHQSSNARVLVMKSHERTISMKGYNKVYRMSSKHTSHENHVNFDPKTFSFDLIYLLGRLSKEYDQIDVDVGAETSLRAYFENSDQIRFID